jgi:hypothetical protein
MGGCKKAFIESGRGYFFSGQSTWMFSTALPMTSVHFWSLCSKPTPGPVLSEQYSAVKWKGFFAKVP